MRPDHKHKTVLVIARGRKGAIAMSSREAAAQLGRSRGGQTVQRLGRGHRWTSKEASEMARRSHAKGARRRSARRRKAVDHAAARRAHMSERGTLVGNYAYHWTPQAWFGAETQDRVGYWERIVIGGARQGQHERISERTALRHLGYTPFPRKGLIPERILSATPGSPLASQVQPKEDR